MELPHFVEKTLRVIHAKYGNAALEAFGITPEILYSEDPDSNESLTQQDMARRCAEILLEDYQSSNPN